MQTAGRLVVIGLVVAAAACGKGDNKDGGDKKSATKQMTIGEVLGATKQASLVGPFTTARFGMSEQELKIAVPLYAEKGDYLSTQDFGIGFYAYVSGPPGDESAKKAKKRFTSMIVTVKDADVNAIKAAWGPPTELEHRGEPASVWLNPAAHIRALLQRDTDPGVQKLRIEPYLPTKELLGEPSKPLGIESKRALLGSTPAELEAAYPDNYDRTLETLTFMNWEPDDFGDQFKMQLGMKDGKVATLQYWITHGDNAKLKADTKALLEAKYGPAKEVKREYLGPEMLMSENPKVRLAETKGGWVIEIGEP